MKSKLFAEVVGTYLLVFCGTGAVVVDAFSGGAISHLGIALAFGMVVMAMIYALGDISGAHLNPAVSIGFAIAKRTPWSEVPPFLAAQFLGAVLASGSLALLFPDTTTFGQTVPAGGAMQSFFWEILLTFLLMLVILRVSTGSKEKGITAGIAVGMTVALCALFGGPVSGASMNPARSLGPAVFASEWSTLWIYFAAPLLGAALAVYVCCGLERDGCCDT